MLGEVYKIINSLLESEILQTGRGLVFARTRVAPVAICTVLSESKLLVYPYKALTFN